MKFQIDINLDDEQECVEFLRTHMIHPGPSGRRLSNKLGFKGRGAGLAAKALWNYAMNRQVAFTTRREGRITTALQYEAICDRIYRDSIRNKIECW